MSFDSRYPNRKDRRRPYYGAARFDRSCRPGGRCPYCRGNRTYATRKARAAADFALLDAGFEKLGSVA